MSDPPSVLPPAATPIARAVSQAYQVFDRYLQEGREAAANQSAWYNGPLSPTASTPPAVSGAGDLASAAMWLFEQMKGATSGIDPKILAPLVGAGASTPAATWPQPHWPPAAQETRPPADPAAAAQETPWTEEAFEEDAAEDVEEDDSLPSESAMFSPPNRPGSGKSVPGSALPKQLIHHAWGPVMSKPKFKWQDE